MNKIIENLITKIDQIFTQFIQEELGNRLSQFAMKSLRDMILNEIQNYGKDEKGKDDKKISK